MYQRHGTNDDHSYHDCGWISKLEKSCDVYRSILSANPEHHELRIWTSFLLARLPPRSSFCLREKLEAGKPADQMNLQQVEVISNDKASKLATFTVADTIGDWQSDWTVPQLLRKSGNWPGALFLLRTGGGESSKDPWGPGLAKVAFPVVCAEECLDMCSQCH